VAPEFMAPKLVASVLVAGAGAAALSMLMNVRRGQVVKQQAPGAAAVPAAGAQPMQGSLPPLKLGPSASFVLPKGAPRCGLVWMHGLGDTEEGWADILEEDFQVSRQAGPCKFILPRAPVQHVTCNEERTTSWFDMATLPLDASDDPPRHGCSMEQALASCGRVHGAIEKLKEEGIPAERIAVGGFSQGGAMALLSALTYPQRLAGVVVFSGIVFFPQELPELAKNCKGMEVFWGHGTQDTVLGPSLQDAGVKALTEAGLKVTAKKYPTVHSSTQQEMEDAAAFFSKLVQPA